MKSLTTSFAGLVLKSPIIASSSSLTATANKNKALAESGVGAIVLKSLFEEQIMRQTTDLLQNASHTEADDYMASYIKSHLLSDYITLIKQSKAVCACPIIASVSCYDSDTWIDFAKEIEKAGADALEVNVLAFQTEMDYVPGTFENEHAAILAKLKKTISIPIIMKLGRNFTNPIYLMNKLYAGGAAAVVLFNRFYQPDIDIDKIEQSKASVLSAPSEIVETLRWTSIASGKLPRLTLLASGGIATPQDAVKALLAGATALEVCSTLYRNGVDYVQEMNQGILDWATEKGYDTIEDFRGKVNSQATNINTFERTQFLKYFNAIDK